MLHGRKRRAACRTIWSCVLRHLLTEDPLRASALISWGRNCSTLTHPLHYVSDMLFNGALQKDRELLLIDALIEAGADLNFQRNDEGDTPLIGAASVVAEEVGLPLLEAGDEAGPRGLFGETAPHWAALLDEDRLAANLVEKGADVSLNDDEYKSSPLGWAIHGFGDPPAGNHGRQREVAALLVAAGATLEPQWLEDESVKTDPAMLAALRRGMR